MAAGIGAALGVASALYQAHTARLQNATNENQAADILIPAFDADLRAIGANYENGSWTAAQCISILQQVDMNCYNYLRKQVGRTGTMWTTPPANGANAAVPCNKACTVGCCLYYNDLRPAIYGQAPYNTQGNVGMIPVLQGSKGQPITGHTNQAYVPEVYPPSDKSYGNYQRAAYWINLSPPPKNAAKKAIVALPSLPEEPSIPVPTVAAKSSVPLVKKSTAPGNSALSLLTNNNLATIVGVVGGIILIIAYLFGSNAVRINK